MEKYNSYKNSGIEWLGDIPEHWKIERVKNIFKNLDSKRIPLSGSERQKMSLNRYDYYGASGVIDKVDKYIFNDTLILIGEDGANLVTSSKPLAFIAQGKFWVNNHAHILKPKFDNNINYFVLALESLDYSIWISGSAQPKLTQDKLNNISIYYPPLKEQTQIANYLDAKTTAINKKVSLLQQKIKHYKAYRKTLINETVTKGLKNNNSNWVNYRLKDIGYLYSGLSGKSGNDFNQDHNPNNKGFIPFTNIANNTYLDQNHLGNVVIEEKEKQNQVKQNDIFFLMSSEGYEDIGKSAVLKEEIKETYLNSFCKGFRITKNNCEASFINYLLLSDSYRQKMLVEGKGFTRINLKMEKVNNFSILIPPTKKEQQQIADYLDAKTATIDKIVKNIETQITTLKELRKTLINEVVTGKVKVSD